MVTLDRSYVMSEAQGSAITSCGVSIGCLRALVNYDRLCAWDSRNPGYMYRNMQVAQTTSLKQSSFRAPGMAGSERYKGLVRPA
jgi:hypothetical protein